MLLDTASRLNACGPGGAHSVGSEKPADAFQLLYEDFDLEEKLSAIFKDVFGFDLILNPKSGSRIPLYVGDRTLLQDRKDQSDKKFIEAITRLSLLNDQGDGMKSFAAIMMAVKALPRSLTLIDEPEAFLHPPQERRVGRFLSEAQPQNSQIIIATHSENVIQGLLTGRVSRVSVIRLTRNGNINNATPLNNAQITELWRSPILRYSNILSGLFHEGVVITEADADCRFYEGLADLPRSEAIRKPDLFFTHSGGKDRLPILIAALKASDVPVRAIADVDVLREEKLLNEIVSALGGDWASIRHDWDSTRKAVEQRKNWFRAGDLRKAITDILAPLKDEAVVDSKIVQEITRVGRQTSPWNEIKSNGLPGPLKGQAAQSATALVSALASAGLFVVTVGEMESFAKTVGGHGPRWVETILERDLSADSELEAARQFVNKIIASFSS